MAETSVAVPPVVAVVVAGDPGPWFEETLGSLEAQSYPALSVLVIDTAGAELDDRVAAVSPDAVVHSVDASGYGDAANSVLESVSGAGFFLFLHDDVALDGDSVSLLVEEAFRSNAGIIGPKLLDWGDRRRIRSVGMAVDKTGVQAPYAEPGELDQEQHDRVRDVFALQGGALLVRCDLFESIGGFDPAIDYLGDDVDLCWRAHVVGARVMVAPDATARHLEALGVRRPDIERRHRLARHRIRTISKCYGWLDLMRVLPQAVMWSVAEIVFSLVTGRFAQARDLTSAWFWNLRRSRSILKARRSLKKLRRVRDSDIRRLQVGGSARFTAYLRGQIGEGSRFQDFAARGREMAGAMSDGPRRMALLVWGILAVFFLFGARHLITRGVVSFGQFDVFPSRGSLLHSMGAGWSEAELGSSGAQPAAIGLLGLAGSVLLGATGLLRQLLILGMVPLGWVGAWRLSGPLGSRRGRLVAAVSYAAVPLAYDAIAEGRWDVLLLYGTMPFIVLRLAKLIGVAPYGASGGDPGPGVVVRAIPHQTVALSLLLAVVAAFEPMVLLMVPGLAAVLVVASILTGSFLRPLRAVVLASIASGIAAVMHLPWLLRFVDTPQALWDSIVGPERGGPTELVDLMRFAVGRWSTSWLAYGIVAAAALSLVLGREWRAAWAPRAWSIALFSFATAWVSTNDIVPRVDLPDAHLLLVPAGVGLAWATGITFASFEHDVPRFGVRARRLTIGLGSAAVVAGVLPALAAASGGTFGAPGTDLSGALRFITVDPNMGSFRVMWIGDPVLLPAQGREITDSVSATTSVDGLPDVRSAWQAPPTDASDFMVASLQAGLAGDTARLGRLLAPMGVRYVVVPQALAPIFAGAEEHPGDQRLLDTLAAQLDLRHIATDASVVVFENAAWHSIRAVTDADNPVLMASAAADLAGTPPGDWFPALPNRASSVEFTGAVPSGTVVVGVGDADHWVLEINGAAVPRSAAHGWAAAFPARAAETGTLRHVAEPSHTWLLLAQWVAWVIVARLAFIEPRRAEPEEGP